MFAKLLLPLLGGTPSVWNTALVFFQAVLLVGYGYAHLTTRLLPVRRQLVLHTTLLLASVLVALPLRLRLPGDPPDGDAAIPWLVLVLTMSLAFPFMMLASGAPLLQRWFASSNHAHARDPYFLYAASNLGSLLALVSYPVADRAMVHTAGAARGVVGGLRRRMLVNGLRARVERTPSRRDGVAATAAALVASEPSATLAYVLTRSQPARHPMHRRVQHGDAPIVAPPRRTGFAGSRIPRSRRACCSA